MNHVESFIEHLTYIKKYSPHTILAYSNDLSQFFSYIELQYSIADISATTHHMVRSWIVMMSKEKISSRSINRKISSLNVFYKFLLKNRVVEINPMLKITAPKAKKGLPSYVSQKDMNLIIDRPIYDESSFKIKRNHLMMSILYFTGMRRSELISLSDENINMEKLEIKVLGKGKKERIIPITKEILSDIEEYKTIRNENFEVRENFLFLSDKGKKIDPRVLYSIINNILLQADSTEKKSPHVLRHSFATHMLNEGADINAIKELLGHTNLAATQVYTHNSIERLKNIYKNSHPKSKET